MNCTLRNIPCILVLILILVMLVFVLFSLFDLTPTTEKVIHRNVKTSTDTPSLYHTYREE